MSAQTMPTVTVGKLKIVPPAGETSPVCVTRNPLTMRCIVCRAVFPARRQSGKYCGNPCKMRARNARDSVTVPPVVVGFREKGRVAQVNRDALADLLGLADGERPASCTSTGSTGGCTGRPTWAATAVAEVDR